MLILIGCSNTVEVNIDGNIRKMATLNSNKTYFKSKKDISLLMRISRSLINDYSESNFIDFINIAKGAKQDDFENWERLMGEFIKSNCHGKYNVKKLE